MTAINYVYGICNKLVNDKQLAEDLTIEIMNGLETRFHQTKLSRNDILQLMNKIRKLILHREILTKAELTNILLVNRT